jgi:hypothetical protein
MIDIKNLMMGGFDYVKNYGLRFFISNDIWNINTDRHLQKLQKSQILHGELVNQYRLAHWMVLQGSRRKVAGSQ